MLVNKIMQVLKNLFGLNKKISASEIAIKDSNNNASTLDIHLKGDILYQETNWENMKKGLDIISADFSPYKYLDVYFCSNGFIDDNTEGGNGINDILRIDLTIPSNNHLLQYNSIDWKYGISKWYPDAQFFIGITYDPGFFIEAVFVNADKNSLLIGKSGWYSISSNGISMHYSDDYYRVCKVVGYR